MCGSRFTRPAIWKSPYLFTHLTREERKEMKAFRVRIELCSPEQQSRHRMSVHGKKIKKEGKKNTN